MKDASPAGGLQGTPDATAKSVVQRFQRAKRTHDHWRALWQEAFDYALPNRQGFEDDTPGGRRNHNIFDETAVVGVPRFASRLQVGFFPPHGRAFRLEPGPQFEGRGNSIRIQRDLDQITDLIHQALRNSNFAAELHEGLQDLAVGTMNLTVESGDYPGDLRFQSVPLTQIVLEEGAEDYPDGWYRFRKVEIQRVPKLYPRAEIDDKLREIIRKDPDRKVEVIDATLRDRSRRDTEVYVRHVVLRELQQTIQTSEIKGDGAGPWVSARWSKAANEVYGRGPLVTTLPAIKTCNLTVQLILENAEMAIGGMWTYDDDGVFNPDNVTLAPGTFLPKQQGSEVAPLQSAAQFDVGMLVLEDMRRNIRKGLFIDELEKQGKTPLSATEVAERTADVARDMGAVAGRLQSEFLLRLVRRVIHIFREQGLIELPRVDGKIIRVTPQSPLLRAQNMQDIADWMRFNETLAATYGQAASLMTDQDKAAGYLAEKYGIPAELIRSPEERARIMQEMQAQAQQNPEMLNVKPDPNIGRGPQ
jgi:hypothetical protein